MKPLRTDGLPASRTGTDIKQSNMCSPSSEGTRDRAEFRVESFFGLIGGGVGRNLEKENSSSEEAQEACSGGHLAHEAEAVGSRVHGPLLLGALCRGRLLATIEFGTLLRAGFIV